MSFVSLETPYRKRFRSERFRPDRSRLDYRILEGNEVDASLTRALWTFRRRFVRLKPHVSESVDFERFSHFVRHAANIVVVFDAAGEVQMTLMLAIRDDAERCERLLNWEYCYVSPEYRGISRMYAIWLWLIVRNIVRVAGWSTWCVAWAYPASYLVMHNSLPGLVSLQSEGISEQAREVILRFGRNIGDASFDEMTGVRNMPTIPLERFDERPGRAAELQGRREYIAANPKWAEGYTLAVVAPVSIASLGSIAWTVARRSLRYVKRFHLSTHHT